MKRIFLGDKAVTHAVVLEPGEEVMASLTGFASEHGIGGARVWGIGAFESTRLGYLDRDSGTYQEHVVDEQAELLGLHGNLSTYGGDPRAHLHAVLSLRDGSVRGGHLLEARVWPTLELFVVESAGALVREDVSGIPLPLITPQE